MSGVSFRIVAPSAGGSGSASSSSQPDARARQQQQTQQRSSRRRDEPDDSDDSDSDDALDRRNGSSKRRGDEAISGIDERGIRSTSAPKRAAPLVIAAQANTDFRKAAIELRAKKAGRRQFIPNSNGMVTETDSQGRKRKELTAEERAFLESSSNVQRTGDKVVQGGLKMAAPNGRDTTPTADTSAGMQVDSRADTPVGNGEQHPAALDADALALQELLGGDGDHGPRSKVDVIPMEAERQITEDDAYAIDVATRPDTPTLDDYARVPIEDFGMALLRGMGAAAQASGRKPRPKVEAHVPKPRTALLGIGAKSREETFGKEYVKEADKGTSRRDAMRFVPLQRVERGGASASGSGANSPAPADAAVGAPAERLTLENGESGSSSRRNGRHADEDDDGAHRRSRERGRDRDDRTRRDDRDRDEGRRSSRKSRRDHYSDESDEERERRRRRRKEKEREREREREREGHDDRERGSGRSGRADGDKERGEGERAPDRRRSDRDGERDRDSSSRRRERSRSRSRERRDGRRDDDRDRDRGSSRR